MSAQDQRNEIIQEYIPELVKQLTGFAVSLTGPSTYIHILMLANIFLLVVE